MYETAKRRLAIRDFISYKRNTTIAEIASEFNISKSTVRRDLDAITPTTFFYMVPGNGGGIRADESWYASSSYLTPKQEALLRRLASELQDDEDQETMKSILAAFARKNNQL